MVRCLLVGNYRPSLTLMRALKRSGHSVWLGADGYSDYSEWSACADGSIVLPSLDKEHFSSLSLSAHSWSCRSTC